MTNYGAHLRQFSAIGKHVSQQHRARKQVYTLQFILRSNFFSGGGMLQRTVVNLTRSESHCAAYILRTSRIL